MYFKIIVAAALLAVVYSFPVTEDTNQIPTEADDGYYKAYPVLEVVKTPTGDRIDIIKIMEAVSTIAPAGRGVTPIRPPIFTTAAPPTTAAPSTTTVDPTTAVPSTTTVDPTTAVPSTTTVDPTTAVPSTTTVHPTSAVPTTIASSPTSLALLNSAVTTVISTQQPTTEPPISASPELLTTQNAGDIHPCFKRRRAHWKSWLDSRGRSRRGWSRRGWGHRGWGRSGSRPGGWGRSGWIHTGHGGRIVVRTA